MILRHLVPLKYLTYFWRCLDSTLINCEIELYQSWSKKCMVSEILKNTDVPANPVVNLSICTSFVKIYNWCNIWNKQHQAYAQVVTLSINNNINFLEIIKQRFKRTNFGNKWRSEITADPKKNNLNYMIDPIFRNIDRLLVSLLKNEGVDPERIFLIDK